MSESKVTETAHMMEFILKIIFLLYNISIYVVEYLGTKKQTSSKVWPRTS